MGPRGAAEVLARSMRRRRGERGAGEVGERGRCKPPTQSADRVIEALHQEDRAQTKRADKASGQVRRRPATSLV